MKKYIKTALVTNTFLYAVIIKAVFIFIIFKRESRCRLKIHFRWQLKTFR